MFLVLCSLSGFRFAASQEKATAIVPMDTRRLQMLERALNDLADHVLAASEREVLMLWVVDASNSMVDDCAHIAQRLDDFFNKVEGRKVLHMGIIAFDTKPRVIAGFLKESASVRQAIGAVGVSGRGIENCMAAIQEGVRIFPKTQAYRMTVLITDERGDDDSQVEETIAAVKEMGSHVFVLGRESPFGWMQAYEPDAKKGFNVTVRAGPESAGPEMLQMNPLCCRQWYPNCRKALARRLEKEDDGTDARSMGDYESFFQKVNPLGCDLGFDQNVPSGFGCWAQARLAAETGGRYYLIHDQPRYDPDELKGYAPELCSREEWRKRNREDPVRKTIMDILAAIEQGGTFGLISADTVESRVLAQQARLLQKKALDLEAKVVGWIDALDAATPLAASAANPTSRRWLAHRDMLSAQLSVLMHWLEQYRLALADVPSQRATLGLRLQSPFRGSGDRQRSATRRLDLVIRAYPRTPWAMTAETLKRYMLGFRIDIVRYRGGAAKKGSK